MNAAFTVYGCFRKTLSKSFGSCREFPLIVGIYNRVMGIRAQWFFMLTDPFFLAIMCKFRRCNKILDKILEINEDCSDIPPKKMNVN